MADAHGTCFGAIAATRRSELEDLSNGISRCNVIASLALPVCAGARSSRPRAICKLELPWI